MAAPSSLVPLPREEWQARRCGPDHVAIGMHTNGGAIYWTKMALSDPPNDLVAGEDLKRVVAKPIDVAAG